MKRGDTVRDLICISCLMSLLELILLGCQRNNQTYGGAKELDDSPKYGVKLEVNKQASKP